MSYNPETDLVTQFGTASSRKLFFNPSLIVNIIPRRPVVPYVFVGYGAVLQILSALQGPDFADAGLAGNEFAGDGFAGDEFAGDEFAGDGFEGDERRTEVAIGRTIPFGGGVKYYFTDSLGVRFDLRRYDIDPDRFLSIGGTGDEGDVDLDRFGVTEFTVGFLWGF